MNQWIEEKFPLVMQWILDGGHVFEISEEEADLLWTHYCYFENSMNRRQRKREASKKRRAERLKRLSQKYGNYKEGGTCDISSRNANCV